MMSADKTASPDNKAAWEASFDTIGSLEVLAVEEAFPDEWNSVRQYYKYTLRVTLKPGAQPGLWEDGEIVRWIGLTLENGQWTVNEISMNP